MLWADYFLQDNGSQNAKKKGGGGLGKTRETRWKVYTHTKQNKRAVDNLFMSVCTFDSFSLFKCFIMPLSTIPLFRTIMVINRIGHMSSLYRAGPSYIVCREFFSSRSKKKKKKKRNSVLPISWLLPGGVGARKKKKKRNLFYIIKARPIVPTPSFTDVPTRRHLWQSVPYQLIDLSAPPQFSCLFVFFIFFCVSYYIVRASWVS